MATFEQRIDSEGRVTAVRVKVRRAGQAHLSRTFKLTGTGKQALAAALREAREWVQRLEQQQASLADAPIEPLPAPALGHRAPPRKPRSALAQHFDASHDAPMPTADDAAWRQALQALLQCTDLSLAELQSLRWQHLAWDAHTLTLPGHSGLPLRRLPLSPVAVEALLALKCRKHGLVFKQGVEWLARHRPAPEQFAQPRLS